MKPPFPLREPTCRLFARARHGLWNGVQTIGLAEGDEVLVPAYHHGSEIEALRQAGLRCVFYDATETLDPDAGELESLVTPRTRALYVIHYFGFPRDCSRWRSWCDERGLLLLEDAAQAWLSEANGRPVGSFGDLAIFCLYKTIALPDGAALVASTAPPAPADGRPWGIGGVISLHSSWLAGRSQWSVRADDMLRHAKRSARASEHGSLEARPETVFDLGNPATAPTKASLFLLSRLADAGAAERRRAHYEMLLEAFRDRVPLPFRAVDGVSPLIFPLEADLEGNLAERLADRGIEASPFWPVLHPAVPHDAFPGAASWRNRFLALPVHQELRPEDVARVIDVVRGRPRRRALTLEPVEDLESVRDEWNELAEASRNIFSTWEWAALWWRNFGNDRTPAATVCRDSNGRAVAILPIYVTSSKTLRIARFLGHGPGDQLGPVCAPGDRVRTAEALRALLAGNRAWDIFLGEQLPADEGWGPLLGGRAIERTGSPRIRFGGETWDEFLASLSSRFRHEIRADERKLKNEHAVGFRLAADANRLEQDLDTLFALHAARWPDSAFCTRHQPFHREFARAAVERGWLRLWFLEIDERPVAAWYGFRFAGVESHYQGGRDLAWGRSSVGLVLLAHSIREALADGMREYRFLRGGEQHKYRFTKDDPGLETLALARGARGRAALTSQNVARAAREVVRHSSAVDAGLRRLSRRRR